MTKSVTTLAAGAKADYRHSLVVFMVSCEVDTTDSVTSVALPSSHPYIETYLLSSENHEEPFITTPYLPLGFIFHRHGWISYSVCGCNYVTTLLRCSSNHCYSFSGNVYYLSHHDDDRLARQLSLQNYGNGARIFVTRHVRHCKEK